MKRRFIRILVLPVFVLLSVQLLGQDEHVRKFEETFSVNAKTTLEVNSKFGDVEINNWDRREVEIYAEILLRDMSKQKAEQVFQHVEIKIYKSADVIHVSTEFDDEFSRLVGKGYDSDDGRYKINYKIKIPVDLKLEAQCKYGNLFINELASPSMIAVKYGNVKINRLSGNGVDEMVVLDMGYSNGTIEACEWLKITSKYSKLNIEQSKALIVMSKYSKMYIDVGSSIVSESKYDTYEVGVLSNFVAEAQYSNFKFGELRKKLHLDTKYTDVRIKSIPAGFESIEIDNSYGSMKLGIASNASYKLRGYAKYAKINYPENTLVNRFQESNEMRVEGVVGKEGNASGLVKIDTKYGGINLVW